MFNRTSPYPMYEVWKLVPYHVEGMKTPVKTTKKTYKFVLFARVGELALARSLVMEQSRNTPECYEHISEIPHELREHFMYQFCFNDDRYLTYRRFFLGVPPIDLMRRSLRQDGIIILE